MAQISLGREEKDEAWDVVGSAQPLVRSPVCLLVLGRSSCPQFVLVGGRSAYFSCPDLLSGATAFRSLSLLVFSENEM